MLDAGSPLRIVARQVAELQPRVDACIELFRTHPRLGWQHSGETDLLVDELLALAHEARDANGAPAEREALHSIALEEATLLARLRSEADFAERTGHDAPWRRVDLAAVRGRLAQLLPSSEGELPRGPQRIIAANERDRLTRRMTRLLVRTMRSVPAPGIDPLSRRDWALIGMMAALFCLAFVGLALLDGPH